VSTLPVIEKGIPYNGRAVGIYPWHTLQVGDSVFFPADKYNPKKVHDSSQAYATRVQWCLRWAEEVSKDGVQGIRVHRLDDTLRQSRPAKAPKNDPLA